jgi:hypothetical protein
VSKGLGTGDGGLGTGIVLGIVVLEGVYCFMVLAIK